MLAPAARGHNRRAAAPRAISLGPARPPPYTAAMSTAPVPVSPAPADGRHRRAQRTHTAILTALLALVEEGQVAPSAPQIAARAGVALRSIAQHFPSRERMFAAAAARYREVAPRTTAGDPALSVAERVARFAIRRARVLETTAPFRRAATSLAAQSIAAAEDLRAAAGLRRAEVAAAFAPDLEPRDEPARAALLDALDVVCGGRAWDAMREDLGLPAAVAQDRLAFLISAVLAAR